MEDYLVSRFDRAVMLLPRNLRDSIRNFVKSDRAAAEEFRLRIGYPPTVLTGGREVAFGQDEVSQKDIDGVLDIATQASAHSVRDNICAGYVTVQGGYRVGLCGNAIVRGGNMGGFRSLSSLAIRISKEMRGVSDKIMPRILENGTYRPTLIVSPPGGGKTTLLRDMVRALSESGLRVSLADERGEVAAVYNGRPQMDVGRRTDVLDGCPKAEAVMLLLRAMNPQVIALDEITAAEDARAMVSASNCGVKLLATAHADGPEDLMSRELYRGLIEGRIFEKGVFIKTDGGKRIYEVIDLWSRL